jgi:hypothetical protein
MKRLRIAALFTCLSATPAAAFDTCFVGTWWADLSDIADLMTLQTGQSATPMGGDARMDIAADGALRITVRDLRINMTLPDAPPTLVTVNGYSAGSISPDDGVWLANVSDYSLTGSADVLGQTLAIPFTSATGIFGGGAGAYRCSSEQLLLETDPSLPPRIARTWTRG